MRDSETSIGFVQGPPGSRRERVNLPTSLITLICNRELGVGGCMYKLASEMKSLHSITSRK